MGHGIMMIQDEGPGLRGSPVPLMTLLARAPRASDRFRPSPSARDIDQIEGHHPEHLLSWPYPRDVLIPPALIAIYDQSRGDVRLPSVSAQQAA